MKIKVKLTELKEQLSVVFKNIITVSDGGYEKGYNDGYQKGLNQRQYEEWTITLTDGSTVKKEIALI